MANLIKKIKCYVHTGYAINTNGMVDVMFCYGDDQIVLKVETYYGYYICDCVILISALDLTCNTLLFIGSSVASGGDVSVEMTTKSMQLAERIDFNEVINIFAE